MRSSGNIEIELYGNLTFFSLTQLWTLVLTKEQQMLLTANVVNNVEYRPPYFTI